MRELVDFVNSDGVVTMKGGDAGDGAMKTAMLAVGQFPNHNRQQILMAMKVLFPKPGVLIRGRDNIAWHSNPKCTSRDQTTNWICFLALSEDDASHGMALWQLVWAHIKRFGFCQNWEDESGHFKIADHFGLQLDILLGIGIIRGLRLWPLWPLLLILDLFTVGASLIRVQTKNLDDVGDDQNHLVVMRTQKLLMPTPFSWLARKLYYKFRKPTYGCGMKDPDETDDDEVKLTVVPYQTNVVSTVWWYHRASIGAPPMHLAWTEHLKGDLG